MTTSRSKLLSSKDLEIDPANRETQNTGRLQPVVIAVEELAALLQLASPALPIGSFSYSQGLESAIEAGLVYDPPSACQWIKSGLRELIGRCDLPIFFRQYDHWAAFNEAELEYLDRWFVSSRETRELREETEQMAWALSRIACQLGVADEKRRAVLSRLGPRAYPTAFAFMSYGFKITPLAAATAYCFSWLESQVSAALKAVPLGQSDGQRILSELRSIVSLVVQTGDRPLEEATTFAPSLAILSARHENQYTRLFRS
jgi:urease accessory protein